MTEQERRIIEIAVKNLTRIYDRTIPGQDKANLGSVIRDLQDLTSK